MPDLHSIRFRFIALMVLIITVGLSAFGIWHQRALRAELRADLDAQLTRIAGRLGTTLSVAIWEFNVRQVEEIVASEMSTPALTGILVHYAKDRHHGLQRDGERLVPLTA